MLFHALPSVDEASMRMVKLFEHHFQRPPAGIARAPGRVNLIGEHVDYEGYAVLPMAIEQSIYVAYNVIQGSSNESVIHIANAKPQYKPVTLLLNEQKLEHVGAAWAAYVLCGVLELRDAWSDCFASKVELQILVNGNIPAGCGLSSSSALVVATTLATCCALQLPTSRPKLAELCRQAERRVGTMGGGMDQAVACLAQRGAALYLDFSTLPAKSEPVVVPDATAGVTFVVANSLVVAEKAVDAATRYNKRVVECALAAMMMAKKAGLENWNKITRLVDVHNALSTLDGENSFNELKTLALTFCPLKSYSIAEIEAELGRPIIDLFRGSSMEVAVMAVLASASSFKLHQRALHVWGEAERVQTFRNLCDSLTGKGQTDGGDLSKQLRILGEIMQASHLSCKGLYECSCPELDDLVDAAMSAGALGARLTGAGWGGCVVALVQKAEVAAFMRAVRASYYSQRGISSADAVDAMFESAPAPGADFCSI